jgi:amidophosphoribosyltransferase
LKDKGVELSNSSDSIIITEAVHTLVKEGKKIEDAIEEIFPLMTGSFSLLIMTKDKLIALRDQYGIRPLSIAKLNGGYVFASETCAFHPIGANFIRDVNPGEMVVVDDQGLKIKQIVKGTQKLDIFEFVYFSRPDSVLLGKSVYDIRKKFGKRLAEEYLIEADVVIPIPETSIPVAIGYASASGIPFEMGIVKSRYIHRTFIEPEQHIRDQGVKLKLAPLKEFIENKRVIVVDDSIVRGTTSRQIVKMLFETGAKEVHFVISSPPVKYPDFYGIDLPKQDALLASKMSIEEMNKYLGSTTLNFLSYDGMIEATGLPESVFCTSCFNGKYPIDLRERKDEVEY